jgi:sortase A
MSAHPTAPRRQGKPWLAERIAWTVGVLCLAAYAVIRIAGAAGTRRELARFEKLRREPPVARLEAGEPDLALWSPERVQAWRQTLKQDSAPPLAVLKIPKIRLEVPVLDGTDEWTLNRGVGHIAGTALPDSNGNFGIAGHRDGFFRGLKDIARGDSLELDTPRGRESYVVEDIRIVNPEDVWVLAGTPDRTITLVTCYPFYFVGSAPQRYIVRAVQRIGLRSS